MAYLIHSINVTVSGTAHHSDAVADEDHHAYALDLLRQSEAVLLGRHTFDLFEAFWPGAVQGELAPRIVEFAKELAAKPKYVVSSRAVKTAWPHTSWLVGPRLDDVRRLLDVAKGTVVVFGSPGLGASLAATGWIDEIHVVLQPMVGVRGPAAFGMLERKALTLLEAKPFASGAVLLRYAPNPAGA